jgi:copper homeostasis protein
MSNRLLLEVCVESVDDAIAAERGGAQRIELCRHLSCGGVTPSAEMMQTTRRQMRLPIHALIRPRAGDFCYSDRELEIMRDDIFSAKQLGMDGVVLGILTESARVDVERTKALVELARPLPVTFHRAFDASRNLEESLEEVIQTGASRILTSGGHARAVDALPILARLVQAAGGRILLMPCGRIRSENIARIVRATLAQEFHSSVGTSSEGKAAEGKAANSVNGTESESSRDAAAFEHGVREVVSILDSLS